MVRIFLPLTAPAEGEGGEGEKNAFVMPLQGSGSGRCWCSTSVVPKRGMHPGAFSGTGRSVINHFSFTETPGCNYKLSSILSNLSSPLFTGE